MNGCSHRARCRDRFVRQAGPLSFQLCHTWRGVANEPSSRAAEHSAASRAQNSPGLRPIDTVKIAASFLGCGSVITYGKSTPLMLSASPRAAPAGTDVRTREDPTGTELYAVAQSPEGQIAEVGPYLFSKPGTTTPVVVKVSFVARRIWLAAWAIINSSFGLWS